jgi:CubicO group peptidase (beta-lactamase class C family)
MNKPLKLLTSLIAVCILSALILSSCTQDASPFPRSTPEEQGMDSQKLLALLEFIEKGRYNLHSLLILRNGALVLEVYYPPFRAQDKHMLFSTTKSFVSSLVGIALSEGKFQSVDQPILDFFQDTPIQNFDEAKQEIHLHDLLNMASGLTSDDGAMGESTDWAQFTLDQPMYTDPGTEFDYNSGNSHLLSAIIQKTTGMITSDYARKKLFEPLGIQDVYWAPDPAGVSQGGVGLMLTPRDMAKFGLLYLNQGIWNGRQVVPKEWIEATFQRNENEYAYQWWQTENGFSTLGYGGQYIYIFPSSGVVAAWTEADPIMTALGSIEIVEDAITQSVYSDDPLPKSDASQLLADRVKAISNPPSQAIPEPPPMAATIAGKTLRLEENTLGWQTARLDFEGDQAWLTVTTKAIPEERRFAIGLDGLYRLTAQKQVTDIGIPEPEQRNFLNPYEFNFLLGMPIDGDVAMKGEWTTDDTFIITIQDLRDYDQDWIIIKFNPPAGTITWNSFMDQFYLHMKGSLE